MFKARQVSAQRAVDSFTLVLHNRTDEEMVLEFTAEGEGDVFITPPSVLLKPTAREKLNLYVHMDGSGPLRLKFVVREMYGGKVMFKDDVRMFSQGVMKR